jgi:hypothetical protein
MSMHGSCKCRNIEVHWHTVDYSLVPRQCQCDYCGQKDAAYVSKSGTRVDIHIHSERLHNTVMQGSNSALFHECGNCGQLVFVTAEIDGELFGALNANCMDNKLGFSAPIGVDFSNQSAGEKLIRWRDNWCHPVFISCHSTSGIRGY